MIRINEIEFENYRQYKNVCINFSPNSNNNMYILKAKNGTGKTTFLNGILWCLYEKEYFINDKENALPIINSALVQGSKENDTLVARVQISIDDGSKSIKFERTQKFIVKNSLTNSNKKSIAGTTTFKIVVTPHDGSNTNVIDDETQTQSFVKQYFDESIYDYYFFDGEKLMDYFAKGKAKKIKESIYNISQVTLLSNALQHTNKLSTEKSRIICKKNGNDLSKVYDDISKLNEDVKIKTHENDDIEKELIDTTNKFNEVATLLRKYKPISNLTRKRDELEQQITQLEEDYNNSINDKNKFIRKYLVLLNFYPRVKHTLDMIKEKEENGMLPPEIDKDQVKYILENHISNCPVCNSKITSDSITHLEKLLDELDVSSATSNYLMEIKGSLENIEQECREFPSRLDKIYENEKYYTDELEKQKNEIKSINAYLTNYSTDTNDNIDISKLQEDWLNYNQIIKDLEVKRGINNSFIRKDNEQLVIKNEERAKFEEEHTKKTLLEQQMALLRKIENAFTVVQTNITNSMKDEIEKLTWNRFKAMLWKKNTFGKISINDTYELSVFDMNSHEMTGSLSATEYMALAYSFTLAIHDASGKNCPLVVDSPLGRVSDDNRSNMASELLNVSKTKQIIMLFTPDEYSAEVKNIYDNAKISIRNIILADDEKEIEKVGE